MISCRHHHYLVCVLRMSLASPIALWCNTRSGLTLFKLWHGEASNVVRQLHTMPTGNCVFTIRLLWQIILLVCHCQSWNRSGLDTYDRALQSNVSSSEHRLTCILFCFEFSFKFWKNNRWLFGDNIYIVNNNGGSRSRFMWQWTIRYTRSVDFADI